MGAVHALAAGRLQTEVRRRDPTKCEDLAEFNAWEQLASDEMANPCLYDQNVISLVGYPDDSDILTPGPDGKIEVIGVAWAGNDRIESVELSRWR